MRLTILALVGLLGCASADPGEIIERPIQEFIAVTDQVDLVPSSIIHFVIQNSNRREASGARVRFGGILQGGERLDEEFYVPVDRIGSSGNLVVKVRVEDGLFEAVNPQPTRRFTGAIEIELEDPIGVFGIAYVEDVRLEFLSSLPPNLTQVPSVVHGFPDEEVSISGSGLLRPEEGATYAVVSQGRVQFSDGSSRQIANARVVVPWRGSRAESVLRLSPNLFGVRVGRFEGDIFFENVLRTGQRFVGSTHRGVEVNVQRSRVDILNPSAGSRGQKISIEGRGFVRPDEALGYGMYLTYDGTFVADDPNIPPRAYTGASAIIRVPYQVVDEKVIAQDVWYEVTPNKQLNGLGATPGVFTGRITPTLFDAVNEQEGVPWSGEFRVLSTRQIIYLKYLPGFTRALEGYGLANFEPQVRQRIANVLRRDYEGLNVEIRESVPQDFIEYTTVEIGGPDPSGLLNFGYDNSFNDGGKDIGNLFLGDYLGGVNKHSQEAGFLPYGGVFIESFVIFSPSLFPNNFGTSSAFDDIMSKLMPSLGGEPAGVDDLEGMRASDVEAAVLMIANLAGHTASHEVGHALGLAHFPPTVPGYDKKYHNDPPGAGWIMNSGSDRPFEERSEVFGTPATRFSPRNFDYLMSILPLPIQ